MLKYVEGNLFGQRGNIDKILSGFANTELTHMT